jgi:hypothetical protein
MLTDEPMVIQIRYVFPDGSVKDGPRITVGVSSRDSYQRTSPISGRGIATDITK